MLKLSCLISLFLTVVMTAVNYLWFQSNRWFLFSYKIYGGEITVEVAPGLRASHIYGMTPDAVTTHSMAFSPVSFIVCFVILALLIYLILRIISGVRKSV